MQPSACVCADGDPLMEMNRHHLQPAVCCDTPISFDSSESAIQMWSVNGNESRLLKAFQFHLAD